MKYFFCITILIFVITFTTLGQNQIKTPTEVTFYRPFEDRGQNKRQIIFVDDSIEVYLYNDSYFKLTLDSGSHYLTTYPKEKRKLTFNTSPDSVVYIEAAFGHFYTGGWPFALSSLPQYKQSIIQGASINMNKPIFRKNNRVGLGVVFGAGLNDITLGYTTENQAITLSMGGGAGLFAEAGTSLDKHVDLGVQIGFLTSSLTPHVENATFQFTRFNIGTNLSYAIPIQGGLYHRIKIGAGYNFLFGNQLKFDVDEDKATNQQAVRDTWIYKNTHSFNGFVRYESHIGKQFLFGYTLLYQYAQFKFDRGSRTMPIGDTFNTPDGQAILFNFSANYLF